MFFFGFHCSTYDQTYDQIFDGVGINIILLLLYCFVDFDTTAGCVISAVVAQFTQRALLAVWQAISNQKHRVQSVYSLRAINIFGYNVTLDRRRNAQFATD